MVSDQEIHEFAKEVEKLCKAQKLVGGSSVTVTYGRRYARIIHEWGGQTMCWGWVDKTDGTIRRGSWKGPDMRVPPRGKITDPGIMNSMQWTGPPYLK